MRTVSRRQYADASKRLQEKRKEWASRFLAENASAYMKNHAQFLDDYFRESFEKSMVGPDMGIIQNPYAMIALGGYGRQEQCLNSDVDILFLFKKEIPEKAVALIQEIIYPLWDIGLDVGHATRTVKDCISLAGKDFEVLTSLLDARFICGMSPLYSEMVKSVRDKIIFRKGHKIVDWLIQSTRERHKCFGDSAYLLEPNIKEGRGGLRDYHAMLWLAHIKYRIQKPRDLEYQGLLSHEEYLQLHRSLSFVWSVRSGLHLLTKRKYDQLHFEHQVKLADMFGMAGNDDSHAVERFLSELHGHLDVIKRTYRMFLYEVGKRKKWFKFKKSKAGETHVEGLEVKKETLHFSSSGRILESPLLLLEIFKESGVLKIPLSPEAMRLVKEFSYCLSLENRTPSARMRGLFEEVLQYTVMDDIDALGQMHQSGLLTTLIPELKPVENQIEYDTFHVYPIDKHLLRTVRTVRSLGAADGIAPDDLCSTVYEDLEHRIPLLLWAALLHDAGKGLSGDHAVNGAEIAHDVMMRFGYESDEADLAALLVKEHLLLIHAATRRDIEDEETVTTCAERIGNPEALKMLYLLSIADRMATGPKAWNEWTAILVRDLFLKVLKNIEKDEMQKASAEDSVSGSIKGVPTGSESSVSRPDYDGLLEYMSPRYLQQTPAAEIEAHVSLYRALKDQPFVWEIEAAEESNTRRLTVCGKDVPGFFSNIAGTLAYHRINILEAQIHTWRNHIVLTIFKLDPPPDPLFEDDRWQKTKRTLLSVLDGQLDIVRALDEAETSNASADFSTFNLSRKVNVNNDSSRAFTLIEVFTIDCPGLLFRITHALHQQGLNVWNAQIATMADQVVDVFYVKDFDGQKIISPAKIGQIKYAIEAILPETDMREELPSSNACADEIMC